MMRGDLVHDPNRPRGRPTGEQHQIVTRNFRKRGTLGRHRCPLTLRQSSKVMPAERERHVPLIVLDTLIKSERALVASGG